MMPIDGELVRPAQCGLKAKNCPVKMTVRAEKRLSEDKASFFQAIEKEFGLKQWGRCSEFSYPGTLNISHLLYFSLLNPGPKNYRAALITHWALLMRCTENFFFSNFANMFSDHFYVSEDYSKN